MQMSSPEALVRTDNANTSVETSAADDTSGGRGYSYIRSHTKDRLLQVNTPMCLLGGGRWVGPLDSFNGKSIE